MLFLRGKIIFSKSFSAGFDGYMGKLYMGRQLPTKQVSFKKSG